MSQPFTIQLTAKGAPKPPHKPTPAPAPPAPAPAGQEVWWIDLSGQVGDNAGRYIVDALNMQSAHLEAAWPEAPRDQLIHVYGGGKPGAIPDGAFPAYFIRNPDQAGALGYHDVDPQGRPYVKVFTSPTLDNGGQVLTGALSIAVTASHEACELWGDRTVVIVWTAPDGRQFAAELCDACEAFAYPVTLPSGHTVWLSDFLLPAYAGKGSGAFDAMQVLTEPWSIGPNCYAIIDNQAVFAEGYPQWKKTLKAFPASRTARRGAAPQVG